LISPKDLKQEVPLVGASPTVVFKSREAIKRILEKESPRLLVVVGPCSIHDPVGALDYAARLNQLRTELSDHMEIVMRVYLEKPRTSVGWKGMIYDPYIDGSDDIEEGLRKGRKLLVEITNMGMPAAMELLDPLVPPYIADLVSWAAIGARTTESQTHRQMASGLPMPIGFKNGTDGEMQTAVDAMKAARSPHSFLGVDQEGITSVCRTNGNEWAHIVLRGGRKRTNYDEVSLKQAGAALAKANLPQALMVDCSHANSGKAPAQQAVVWSSVLDQRLAGNRDIIGMMVESYIHEGKQPIPKNLSDLKYGVSITDPCMSWENTKRLLRVGYEMLKQESEQY
jgi:3-deoxy-7-phosphoheptulonate synthase